ncbi:DUF4756 family protein [Salmonella enterica]|uniref:DUF4756 family protein n=1 Tax=Salmonella enterica TaxID=28901 RepID=UPI0008A823FF|nr:DUF4756 family protein [Salmonella enterica]EAB9742220.1 DUF4756 family protein [Salmonella enterica subsp. diarizonae]EAW1164436.1 DUF4756 family protein [Salmonella enterica subsp. enterica]EDJ9086161.1 DUF4756 family protein [Salmonella enterica subsp. enterica serovar Vitkin]EDS4951569.1 DUF4756 family protein [Salmonella enterica subsp. enterica serovar Redlands]EDX2476079.1 DUF4756 family protein [Salmonella enterica subsp. diarizonae serovar 16:z10:e,n,x,z15]EGE4753253.1 DUF4756 fam
MTAIKTNNNDLIEYLDIIKDLRNYIPIEEYLEKYFKLREDVSVPCSILSEYRSAHTELRSLDQKKRSLIQTFIGELNPVNRASVVASKTTDEEIVSLVIKQRTEAMIEFRLSVEQALEELSQLSSEVNIPKQKRRKMTV